MDAIKLSEAIMARINNCDKEKAAILQIAIDALGLKGQYSFDPKAGALVPVVEAVKE